MGVNTTVVFTDLAGSTSVFESLGNIRATRAVTQLTRWICEVLQARGGQVIKTLGDGVLTVFDDATSAIHAVVDLQRQHQMNLLQQPLAEHLPIRVGIATGEVEIVNGDCYGDAVNIASRLSDLAGPHEIWVESLDLDYSSRANGIRYRPLGPISVRGRVEPCNVYQVEWHEDQSTDFITMQGEVDPMSKAATADALGQEVHLSWGDEMRVYRAFELPVHIGRIRHCEFVVVDPRVSRTHARLEWRHGRIMLIDMSSYGTWIRFVGTRSELLLRREECVLHGRGQIALGAAFSDASAPTLNFEVS
ncbi:MAG: adenylate/guanylate cyclase domain-containing protein [Hylemonella sp.]|nr:adenylate/guanylate cyclase domain-containing protein [Hylemonella sp.]